MRRRQEEPQPGGAPGRQAGLDGAKLLERERVRRSSAPASGHRAPAQHGPGGSQVGLDYSQQQWDSKSASPGPSPDFAHVGADGRRMGLSVQGAPGTPGRRPAPRCGWTRPADWPRAALVTT